MMISKIFESLYLKIFVNIVVYGTKSIVLVETLNNKGKVESTQEESFDTTGVDEKMYNFITSYTNESPFHYISILDKTPLQGAIPTCDKEQMPQDIQLKTLQYNCYKHRWTYYTSKVELHALKKEYSKIGLDFVFSPFVVLARFFQDKIDTNMAMFVLIEENYITLSVFDNSELLYSKFIDMENDKEIDKLMIEDDGDDSDNIDLDIGGEMDLDDIEIDELDNFGDIEDLDSLDDIDEFADTKDIEEELQESDEELNVGDINSFSEDYQRFLLIQSAINDFYKNRNSTFIESTYIADGIGVSGDLKRYLEEEMFLNVYIRSIDINLQLSELAKAELK